MSINKIIAAIDPRNMHDAVMNKMDKVAVQKRSKAGNVFIKAPALVALSATALVTNVAAAATEAFNLLGKLAFAGVKYGLIKPIRVITWSNAFESIQAKMPDGKSLLDTTVKVAAKVAGIFYSVVGLVAPTFNLRRQEELGNFVNKRKAAEVAEAAEAAKAAEAQKAIDAQKTDAAKKAAADLEAKMHKLASDAKKDSEALESLLKAQAETKTKGKPVATEAAAVARGDFVNNKKAKAAQKALGKQAANEAAQIAAKNIAKQNERLADIAYLEQFAVAEQLKGGIQRADNLRAMPDKKSEGALIEGVKEQVRLKDMQYLEQFANAAQLAKEIDREFTISPMHKPKARALPDVNYKSEDALLNALRKEHAEAQDVERLGAFQFGPEDQMNTAFANKVGTAQVAREKRLHDRAAKEAAAKAIEKAAEKRLTGAADRLAVAVEAQQPVGFWKGLGQRVGVVS